MASLHKLGETKYLRLLVVTTFAVSRLTREMCEADAESPRQIK